jgi:hypothetical protein
MPPKRTKIDVPAEVHGRGKDKDDSDASLSTRIQRGVEKARTSSRHRSESSKYSEETYETSPAKPR